MIIKTVPVEQEGDIVLNNPNDMSNSANELKDIMKTLYEEKKEYWPEGLNLNQFTGIGDKLFLLSDKNGKGAGFVGFQPYRSNPKTNGMATYISIGLLPEYRGKGLARKCLLDLAKKNLKRDDPILWTCNRNNDASLSLYGKLLGSKLFDNLDLQVSD